MNRRGSRTEPLGTPDSTSPMTDFDSPKLTCWVRICRIDATHVKAVPPIPNVMQSSNKDSGIYCIDMLTAILASVHWIEDNPTSDLPPYAQPP